MKDILLSVLNDALPVWLTLTHCIWVISGLLLVLLSVRYFRRNKINIPVSSTKNIAPDVEGISGENKIATQLDLARAYFEMGKHDEASQLLAKIMQEGNKQDRKAAKALEDQLSS